MLYKFKSKAAGDLIMLEPNGRQVLQAIGKDPAAQGIIQASQIPAAISALEAAIAAEEARGKPGSEGDAEAEPGAGAGVSLRQRAVPFLDMLRRCGQAGADIVWGA